MRVMIDVPQCGVGLAVTAGVEPQPDDLARGGGDGGDAAQSGEGCFGFEPFGVVPGRDEEGSGAVDADAVEREQVLVALFEQSPKQPVDLGCLGVECEDTAAQSPQGGLGRVHDGVAAGSGGHPGRLAGEQETRGALQGQADLFWGGEAEMTDLIERLDLGGFGRPLGHHQRPDGLHVAVPALGRPELALRLRGPGRLDGVDLVGLTLPPAFLAVRAVHLHHRDTGPAQITRQRSPHTSRSLPHPPWPPCRSP